MQQLHQPMNGFCKTAWPKGHSICPRSNESGILINYTMISNTKKRFFFGKMLDSPWNILHINTNLYFFIKYLIRHQSLKLETHSLAQTSLNSKKAFYRKVFRFKSLRNSPVSGGVCQTWLYVWWFNCMSTLPSLQHFLFNSPTSSPGRLRLMPKGAKPKIEKN